MFIEEAVTGLLKNDKELKPIIQNRIYANLSPKDPVYPLIIFTYDENDKKSGNAYPIARSGTFIFFCFSGLKSEARQIERAVYNTLASYNGKIDKISIKNISFQGFVDDFDQNINKYFYRVVYTILYKED